MYMFFFPPTVLLYSVSSCLSVLQMYLFVSMDSRLFVLCSPNPSDIQKWVKGKMHPGIFTGQRLNILSSANRQFYRFIKGQ